MDVIKKLAKVLDVKPSAIDVPNIDTEIGLMHTLFALEDRYGLKICKIDDELIQLSGIERKQFYLKMGGISE